MASDAEVPGNRLRGRVTIATSANRTCRKLLVTVECANDGTSFLGMLRKLRHRREGLGREGSDCDFVANLE